MLKNNTTLRGRLVKGLSAQAFGQVVQIIIRLGEVPLFLGFWGTQRYGEWLMLTAIPAYLAMSDGGFTQTSCRDIAIRAGAGDQEGALAVYQSTWALLILLTLVVGFSAAIFSLLVPLNQMLKFTVMTRQETAIVFLLLVFHIMLGFQGGLFNAGYWASGQYPKGMFITSLTRLLEFGGMALAIIFTGGPIQVASSYILGRMVGTILMWWGQRRVTPWLSLGFHYASIKEIRRLMTPSLATLGFPLGNAVNNEGMRLLIGLVLGPSAVAVFSPLRTLSNVVIQPQSIVYQLTEPEISSAYGKGQETLFKRLYNKACQITLWVLLAASIIAIPVCYWILPVWTSGKVVMDWPTFLLLLVDVLIYGFWGTVTLPVRATNQHKWLALVFVLDYVPISLALTYLGSKIFGISGVAGGLLVTDLFMLAYALNNSMKLVKMEFYQWFKSIIKPPIKEIREMVFNLFKINDIILDWGKR